MRFWELNLYLNNVEAELPSFSCLKIEKITAEFMNKGFLDTLCSQRRTLDRWVIPCHLYIVIYMDDVSTLNIFKAKFFFHVRLIHQKFLLDVFLTLFYSRKERKVYFKTATTMHCPTKNNRSWLDGPGHLSGIFMWVAKKSQEPKKKLS